MSKYCPDLDIVSEKESENSISRASSQNRLKSRTLLNTGFSSSQFFGEIDDNNKQNIKINGKSSRNSEMGMPL